MSHASTNEMLVILLKMMSMEQYSCFYVYGYCYDTHNIVTIIEVVEASENWNSQQPHSNIFLLY